MGTADWLRNITETEFGITSLTDTAKSVVNKVNTESGLKQKNSLDLNEIAFELATTDSLRQSLPEALERLKLSDFCSEHLQNFELYILISHPDTAESFLHHSASSSPNPALIRQMHRNFTHQNTILNNPQRVALIQPQQASYLYHQRLFKTPERTVWLLLSLDHMSWQLNDIKQFLNTIATPLSKGLRAWYQQQDKLKQAVSHEKNALSAELHDTVAQTLSFLRLRCATLHNKSQTLAYREIMPMTDELAEHIHDAYIQVRDLICNGRAQPKTDNLQQAVKTLVKDLNQVSDIQFEFHDFLQINLLSPAQAFQVIHIVRESLNNVVKHANASLCQITIKHIRYSTFIILVEDNGIGIDSKLLKQNSFGLQIMRERAKKINAGFTITQSILGGTKIELTLETGDKDD